MLKAFSKLNQKIGAAREGSEMSDAHSATCPETRWFTQDQDLSLSLRYPGIKSLCL